MRLNYLSAQCPFGTEYWLAHEAKVRIRLNYLSAQCPFGTLGWLDDYML